MREIVDSLVINDSVFVSKRALGIRGRFVYFCAYLLIDFVLPPVVNPIPLTRHS